MELTESNPLEFASESFTAEEISASTKAIREQEKARSTFGTPTPIPEEARRLLGSERVRYEVPLHKQRGKYIDKRKLRRFKRNRARWLASMKTHCAKHREEDQDE